MRSPLALVTWFQSLTFAPFITLWFLAYYKKILPFHTSLWRFRTGPWLLAFSSLLASEFADDYCYCWLVSGNVLFIGRTFAFDIFVILPLPQVVFWLVVPKLIKRGEITYIMTVLLLIFLFQYLPKAYHSVCLMRRMQRVTGYVFGTVWWEFALNLIG